PKLAPNPHRTSRLSRRSDCRARHLFGSLELRSQIRASESLDFGRVGVTRAWMDQTPESAKSLPEGLFAALLRQSVDAIVLLERDTRRFVEFSDSWCRLTGFTREELLGRTGTELGLVRAEERAIISR